MMCAVWGAAVWRGSDRRDRVHGEQQAGLQRVLQAAGACDPAGVPAGGQGRLLLCGEGLPHSLSYIPYHQACLVLLRLRGLAYTSCVLTQAPAACAAVHSCNRIDDLHESSRHCLSCVINLGGPCRRTMLRRLGPRQSLWRTTRTSAC